MQLFYDLIRIAVGAQTKLSTVPDASEWERLFDFACKQSLAGVCFFALQSMCNPEKDEYAGMPEELYFNWLSMIVDIQQKNERVNRQCSLLQNKLQKDGLVSSILKGQGVGVLYGSELSRYRQSGDIDIWMDGGFEEGLKYARKIQHPVSFDYINAHLNVFKDTEVELHWRVQALTNLFRNRHLQRWLEGQKGDIAAKRIVLFSGEEITVPSARFNAFYLLLHCYHHMFEGGLGLRQVMDYYFVLMQPLSEDDKSYARSAISQFGLTRFASGMMGVLEQVFDLPEEKMIAAPDQREGEFLLQEIMQNGSFGHFDDRVKVIAQNRRMQTMARVFQHNSHLFSHYPSEFFWAPVWLVWHWVWKRTRRS